MSRGNNRNITDDLHVGLTATVSARLEVARAAKRQWLSSMFAMTSKIAMPLDVIDFIADNAPDDAIRRHERDLRVLERHAELAGSWGSCSTCRAVDPRGAALVGWPCDEIRDLATAYGMEGVL